jgi:hypothetical protein
VVGAVAVIALAGATFYLCGRNRSLKDLLRYSRPPPPRPNTIPPIPFIESQAGSPYSPDFSPKIGHSPSTGLNTHNSWHTHHQRQMSPEMAEGRGLMSPTSYNQGYPNSYNGVDNPTNMRNHYQSGLSEAPWSPGGFAAHTQYASAPQNHELGTDANMASPGLNSPGYVYEFVVEWARQLVTWSVCASALHSRGSIFVPPCLLY